MTMTPRADDALIVVDIQYDFLPGGSLAVAGGDEIVAPVNALARRFDNVVLTQDWHPAGHVSFASSHPGRQPFETIELDYGPQVLWPDHCVIGTQGADFSSVLDIPHAQAVIRKGFRPGIDSYSGFADNDHKTTTGLAGYLRERGIRRIYVVGLATDFCVSWTAEDGIKAGFEAVVIEDATRPIDANGSLEAAWERMNKLNVTRARLADFG
jgi:nicotinamidase/pyrazinamidase